MINKITLNVDIKPKNNLVINTEDTIFDNSIGLSLLTETSLVAETSNPKLINNDAYEIIT